MERFQAAWSALTAGLDSSTVLMAVGACALVYALSWCRLYAKVGKHPSVGFLTLVPGLNVLLLAAFAFGRWPIDGQLKEMKRVRKDVHRSHQKALRKVA